MYICIDVQMCGCPCQDEQVKVRELHVRFSSLLPDRFHKMNSSSSCQAWQQAPLPTELSYPPKSLTAPGFHSFFCRKPHLGILILHQSSPAPFRCIWMLHAQDNTVLALVGIYLEIESFMWIKANVLVLHRLGSDFT